MKITVLIDNVAGGKLIAEHGLSYLIEHDGHKILFDTGHSGAFLKNAQNMGIDIQNNIETVVLSHGHWDHGDGLRYIQEKTLLTHPDSLINRYREKDHSYIGLTLSKDEIEKKFNLITTPEPYYITNKIIFLGGIPRENNFEAQSTTFVDGQGNQDYVPDDSAMALIQNNELLVISGCAHSGICNIIEYAKKVSGLNKVKLVIGGFHLKYYDIQTEKTIEYIKNQKIEHIYPSHCTELPALTAFYHHFHFLQVKTGMIFKF
ncbi:MAG: MBL fold metallo-hydrolase [Bacteroidota bacterium]